MDKLTCAEPLAVEIALAIWKLPLRLLELELSSWTLKYSGSVAFAEKVGKSRR